jgi:regulator of RNase E activity RraA
VYVAGVGPILTTAALAGGLSSNYFQKLGFEGVILGGAVRDLPELKKLSIPILASNPIPVDTQGAYRVVSTGRSCVINNKIIQTGDLIVSDESGTVVIPKDRVKEVIGKAIDIDATETRILELVKGGARLEEIVSEQGRI